MAGVTVSEYLHVKSPFPDQLAGLGWTVIDSVVGVISFDRAVGLRTGLRERLLPEVCREAVRSINRTDGGEMWLTGRQLDKFHGTDL